MIIENNDDSREKLVCSIVDKMSLEQLQEEMGQRLWDDFKYCDDEVFLDAWEENFGE